MPTVKAEIYSEEAGDYVDVDFDIRECPFHHKKELPEFETVRYLSSIKIVGGERVQVPSYEETRSVSKYILVCEEDVEDYYIWCCNCIAEGPHARTPAGAVDAWNKRRFCAEKAEILQHMSD